MINEEPNYWPRYTVKDHHRLRHQFSESEKIKNQDDSLALLTEYLGADEKILDFSAHKKYSLFPDRANMYQFTVKLLSLEFLSKLAKDKRVKNVYFASRHAHPGGGADSISLRQKILIDKVYTKKNSVWYLGFTRSNYHHLLYLQH